MRNQLKWLGDSLIGSDLPALVTLQRADGAMQAIPLRDALAVAVEIDTYGLKRIVTALEYGFACGELAGDDMSLWARDRIRVLAILESRSVINQVAA
ncbi:hypothetical protein [Paraburkholderia pallida]|uniref:Uncharacterized protein n=1 Tax=Paraburkholderia pallida TaxID=2547399 RepID=A0A4P7CUT4_9BURK|nr:hypothetical protein [Paraburkholderia pallida]QBQ97899.1 hypothetical protein E1956_12410 [Paraburkholderia pallida]